MRAIVAAIHGILTRQTTPSWPDAFDAWMYRRDPEVKVLKKEYLAGPFPRWNCLVKDPWLSRGLASELELFSTFPPVWLVAHSNGAVIALLVTKRLLARGCQVGGIILTGAACEADVVRNGVLDWLRSGRLGAAIAYSSAEDAVLSGDPRAASTWPGKIRAWLWGRLMYPYGCLGRTGWLLEGHPLPRSAGCQTCCIADFQVGPAAVKEHTPGLGQTESGSGSGARGPSHGSRVWQPAIQQTRQSALHPPDRLMTRWFAGGHSGYFAPGQIEETFERIYADIREYSHPQPPQVS